MCTKFGSTACCFYFGLAETLVVQTRQGHHCASTHDSSGGTHSFYSHSFSAQLVLLSRVALLPFCARFLHSPFLHSILGTRTFFFLFFFSFLCSLVFALLLMHSSCALLFCFALLFLLCRASFFCTRLCTRFCVSSFLQLLSFAFLFCTPLYLRTRRSFAPRADPLPSPALHPHHHHHHHPHPQRHPGLQ